MKDPDSHFSFWSPCSGGGEEKVDDGISTAPWLANGKFFRRRRRSSSQRWRANHILGPMGRSYSPGNQPFIHRGVSRRLRRRIARKWSLELFTTGGGFQLKPRLQSCQIVQARRCGPMKFSNSREFSCGSPFWYPTGNHSQGWPFRDLAVIPRFLDLSV